MWERFSDLTVTTAGSTSPVESLLAAPGLISGAPTPLDELWTLRRMRLACTYSYQFGVALADIQSMIVCMLYRKGVNDATVVPPSAPGTADVLDIWTVGMVTTIAGSTVSHPLGMYANCAERDIKVQRKLDADEAIFVSIQVIHITPGTMANFVGRLFVQCSNLWSRTQRK